MTDLPNRNIAISSWMAGGDGRLRGADPYGLLGNVVGYDVGPKPVVSLNSVQFPRTIQGTTAQQTIQLKNAGTRPLTFVSISGGASFDITAGTGVTILPGGSIDVDIEFSPLAPTSSFITEIVTFNLSEGATPFTVTARISASKTITPPATVNHGAGGTLTVSADNTDYVLTADVNKIVFAANVVNSFADTAGFDVLHSTDHGVEASVNLDHCGITDSVGGSSITQSGTTTAIHSVYFNSGQVSDFYINGNITSRPTYNEGRAIEAVDTATPTGLTIDGFNVESTVSVIANRHALQGVVIKLQRNLGNGDSYNQIRNVNINTVSATNPSGNMGGCQGGIFANSKKTQVTGCVINHTATYTNGFAVYCSADGVEVWGNTVGDGVSECSGRGIGIGESNVLVWDNIVNIRQDRAEVDGTNNTYGLQADPGGMTIVNSWAFDNTITATANESGGTDFGAYCIRITDVNASSSVFFVNNTVNCVREGATTPNYFSIAAASFSASQGFVYSHNTMTSDGSFYNTDWDGFNNDTVGNIGNSTLIDGANLYAGLRYYLNAGLGGANTLSGTFHNDDLSASALDFTDYRSDDNSGTGSISLTISHDVTVHVSSAGTPIFGALVVIDDLLAAEVLNTTTDANGDVVAPLKQLIFAGVNTVVASETLQTPHNIDVTAAGFDPSLSNSVTADNTKTTNIEMVAA